ncbi:hypothetical protein [Vibrio thalassae]|nr:hypothetical protein [Vibrio thalassae]
MKLSKTDQNERLVIMKETKAVTKSVCEDIYFSHQQVAALNVLRVLKRSGSPELGLES